jgi:hypothetical protein
LCDDRAAAGGDDDDCLSYYLFRFSYHTQWLAKIHIYKEPAHTQTHKPHKQTYFLHFKIYKYFLISTNKKNKIREIHLCDKKSFNKENRDTVVY